MKNFAIVLSGCGHRDGSEITESIATLIALGQLHVSYSLFAPDVEFSVIDPLTGKPTQEKRNVLREAGRIARGTIQDIHNLKSGNCDGLIFPGGFGAAVTLCDFASKGARASVLPEVEQVIRDFHAAGKPIAGICIAPALLARVLGAEHVTVTIGRDEPTAAEILKTGALHENCAVDDFVTDRDHRLVTTPAYMYDDATPAMVFTGISKAMRELVGMA